MVQLRSEILVVARPAPLLIDPHKTAVVVVDMQHGFFGSGGAWDRIGVAVAGAQAIVAPTARVLAAARGAGLPVVYLTMAFAGGGGNDLLWDAARGERWLALAGAAEAPPQARALPPGVEDADILAELAPASGDTVIVKPRHSGFYNTNLHDLLQARGITTLVFTGGTTSVCVESTLRDAYFRDYRCLLLADCVAEPIGHRLPRTNHEATLLLVEVLFGWVAESAALAHALSAGSAAADAR
jgi:ureidoacrylate peracid hydrolase